LTAIASGGLTSIGYAIGKRIDARLALVSLFNARQLDDYCGGIEKYAKVCVELTRESDTPDVRVGLSHMARHWILACVQARKERDKQQRTRS
jgi:hypothetical protein